MKSIDQWKTDKFKDPIIAEQQEEILKLTTQLVEAKQELKDARKLETADYQYCGWLPKYPFRFVFATKGNQTT